MINDFEWPMRFALMLAGVGAGGHYFLMTNFIVTAPHWMRILALPGAVGPAVGMVVCGVVGAVDAGLMFSLVANVAMVAIQLEAWREGAHVSEQLAKAAHFRRNQQAIIRDMVTGVDPFVEMELARQREARHARSASRQHAGG